MWSCGATDDSSDSGYMGGRCRGMAYAIGRDDSSDSAFSFSSGEDANAERSRVIRPIAGGGPGRAQIDVHQGEIITSSDNESLAPPPPRLVPRRPPLGESRSDDDGQFFRPSFFRDRAGNDTGARAYAAALRRPGPSGAEDDGGPFRRPNNSMARRLMSGARAYAEAVRRNWASSSSSEDEWPGVPRRRGPKPDKRRGEKLCIAYAESLPTVPGPPAAQYQGGRPGHRRR